MIRLAAAALAGWLMIVPAYAHPDCPNPVPEDQMFGNLASKAGEITMMQATKGEKDNNVQVLFTISQNGTWSVVTVEDGQACMVIFGRSFSFVVGDPPHPDWRPM